MSQNPASKVSFLSVEKFKSIIGVEFFDIMKNPTKGTISVLADNGQFFRCEQAIDTGKPVAWLIPDGNLDEACLVNVSSSLEKIARF